MSILAVGVQGVRNENTEKHERWQGRQGNKPAGCWRADGLGDDNRKARRAGARDYMSVKYFITSVLSHRHELNSANWTHSGWAKQK